ncbi:MAG: ABC transporter substrate-binding protein [Candidatus Wallbacteria bacterium]|nr:ABC transporter substrate-binding protein [Candidatus Wallbacteria bacterium]
MIRNIPGSDIMKLLAIVLLASGMLLLSGCRGTGENKSFTASNEAGPDAPTLRYGGFVIRHIPFEPDTLNPLLPSTCTSRDLLFGEIFLPLHQMFSTWEVNSAGDRITVRLKDGLFWHDGTPVTTRDLAFSFSPDTGSFNSCYGGAPACIASIEIIDSTACRLIGRVNLAGMLGNPLVLPEHIYNGPCSKEATLLPVGCGPFSLKEWRRGECIVLGYNPSCIMGRPFLDEVVIKFLSNNSQVSLELLSGNLDLASLTFDQFVNISQDEVFLKNFTVIQFEFESFLLVFNCRMDCLSGRDVRIALSRALDRQAIAVRACRGIADPAENLFPPSSEYHVPFDARLFSTKECGLLLPPEYLLAGEAHTRGSGGKVLRIASSPYAHAVLAAEGVSDCWKAAGISSEVMILRGEDVFRLAAGTGWDVLVLNIRLYQDEILEFLGAVRRLNATSGTDPFTTSGYSKPEFEDSVDFALKVYGSRLKDPFRKIQEIVHEDMPFVALVTGKNCFVHNRRIRGLEFRDFGFTPMSSWFIPQD